MFQRSTKVSYRSFSVLAPLKTLPTKPLNDGSVANTTSAIKLKQFKPLSANQKAYLDRVIRVDQAGELGADYIYAGQYFVLAHKYPHLKPVLKHMWDQEVHHHKTFDALQVKHNVRPSLITPLWKIGAFAMGAGTALISPQAAMACTEAVETVIGGHYNDQLRALHKNFDLQLLRSTETAGSVASTAKSEEIEELINTIRMFRDDELEHLDTAIKYDSHAAVPYMLLTEGIKTICRVAVFTAERI
ncbi:Catabolite repression protein cat5 [Hanseniaspora osmophila]|uniref:5-demethoxyubiquinone hydroxylase, mitochondrial n=1 Tax=Hanseniaspora osmophila TaxID=56408 RepID=A0A1E5RCR7_9ASCO|nr:5-demethoxyubiquinone hydroxylase, mitochondrial [Hanseniaspora osmophila]